MDLFAEIEKHERKQNTLRGVANGAVFGDIPGAGVKARWHMNGVIKEPPPQGDPRETIRDFLMGE